ncbi:MAG: hypothetical protein ACJ8M1_09750, partial [Chthoniobacterales bacterium]
MKLIWVKPHSLWLTLALLVGGPMLRAQSTSATVAPSPAASPASEEETIVPTFETQKLARTYMLDVPAPRGLITDR